jgi:ectoine hydroxylase-related dioxygenase (phytanoyl-CoA dioxygenase family)
MNINFHIKALKKKGVTTIENVFSKKESASYVKKCNELFAFLLKKNITHTFSKKAQIINSPFQYGSKVFYKQVYFSKLNKLFCKLLEKDYVCINTNLINRRNFSHPKIKSSMNRTGGWHTDTRTIGGKIVFRGLSYICTLALEDFTLDNGGTEYIPGSHLNVSIPKRHANYKHHSMVIKAGTAVIFDSALWHKGGKSSGQSRWSIVNYYGPWWMKPYYDFEKQLGVKKISKFNKYIKKMLHYYCMPPKNDHLRISTVVKS